MAQPAERPTMSYVEYVRAEAASDVKHEWLLGEVHSMAGGSAEHAALAAAMIRDLGAALRDRPCRVFTSDVRIKITATGLATYPDVSVVCGRLQTDPDDDGTITNPVVLVEVLSDSTEAYDRGQKFAHYRRLPSLREYVLVSQHEPHIEVFRRTESGIWQLGEWRAGEAVDLASIACSLPVSEIYRDPLAEVAG